MKRGFALLETIIVITFLAVSLLLLYGTFSNMVNNSKKNILYDDISNIYKTYYVKEYLLINNLNNYFNKADIIELNCQDFKEACKLKKEFNINKMYLTIYDLKNTDLSNYSSNFNNYVLSLSNKDDFKYRLILEFNNENTYSYASVGVNYE